LESWRLGVWESWCLEVLKSGSLGVGETWVVSSGFAAFPNN
jgi:hypothetical protein